MTISFSSQKWLDLLDELLGKEMDLHTFAPCKHVAKMQKLRSKSRAKMINVTFAYQHHRIVNKEANVEFAFPRSLSSFHNLSTNLHGASFCKSIFSSSESSYYSVLVSIPSFFFFNMNEQIFCSEIGLFSAIRARIGGGWIGLRISEFGLKSARIEDLCDK